MTDNEPDPSFSFARLAATALGSAAFVLIVTTAIIAVVKPGAGLGLLIALCGVAGAVAAMALASRRAMRRAFPGEDPPA